MKNFQVTETHHHHISHHITFHHISLHLTTSHQISLHLSPHHTTTSHHPSPHLTTSHLNDRPTNQVGIPPNPNLSQINRHNILKMLEGSNKHVPLQTIHVAEDHHKNEDVIRKLVCHSCDTSKCHGKRLEVSSAPPLQIAEYINSIKTKQENFELKLEQSQSLGSPRSWLKIGCSKQRPKALRQISPRKLQAVISSHPTRYFAGSSCTWHMLLETPKGVTKEPTHLASQSK